MGDDASSEILDSNPNPSASKCTSRKMDYTLPPKNLPTPIYAAFGDKQEYQRTGKSCKMEEEDDMVQNGNFNDAKSKAKFGKYPHFYDHIIKNASRKQECSGKSTKVSAYTFLEIILESYLRDKVMIVPASFARIYMRGASKDIRVKSSKGDGRERAVQSDWIRRGGCLRLNGWAEFYNDNYLVEADVCLFELIHMRNIVLKASVFPAYLE
ncbi:B3 domain-containing transcription factor VRN1 [Ricinus communis]|uniref:B3 domain-containing transcription factor VRN1 n=1 Tax=Ricinus communis TaxID=3988 RepID=UPI0007724725|nr:B3 domain-containing transcription factor VRN1 [Ricinus communis]|eukprot:XP_015574564.1 B3 domain-containing transcription factor VRN1 [Ricinus communis]